MPAACRGMGASPGREAARKQAGAAFASLLARWFGISPSQRRLLVACGTGAGIAAVYNVPFGGALFALEVLLGTLALPLVAPALAVSLIAGAVAWLFRPDQPTHQIRCSSRCRPPPAWAAAPRGDC